jgi:hypothetical protein
MSISSIDLDPSFTHTDLLWQAAEQNAKVQGNETHKRKVSTSEKLQSGLRQTTTPPLSLQATSTSSTLKRKADPDSPDVREASPIHQSEFEAGSSTYENVLYSIPHS